VAPQWISGYWVVASFIVLGYLLHFMPQRMSEFTKQMVIKMPLFLQTLLIVIVIYIVIQIKTSDVLPFIYFQF
jgi:hypothetical protein